MRKELNMEKQKKFGFISNFIYALNMEKKSNLMLLVITLIKPIADIVCTLLRSYTPKYVPLIENFNAKNYLLLPLQSCI